MKFGLYTIRDTVTEVFTAPWISQNNAAALRTFSEAARDPQTNINKHPDDFTLVRVGQWDDDTATIEIEEHVNLARGSDFNEQQST